MNELITLLKPGMVAESAMNLSVRSCLLRLSAIMWSMVWEEVLIFLAPWLGLRATGPGLSRARLAGRGELLEERGRVSGVAGTMVELSKDRM